MLDILYSNIINGIPNNNDDEAISISDNSEYY